MLDSIGKLRPDADVTSAAERTVALLERLGHSVDVTAWPIDGEALVADFRKLYCSAALEVLGLARLVVNPKPVALAALALKGIGLMRRGIGRMPDTSHLEPMTFAMAREAAALSAGELERAKGRLKSYDANYAAWFANYDVILSPVLLTPPVPIGHLAGTVETEVLLDRVFAFADYTLLHNIVGAPAMSVPLHWTASGLPVGLQFAAPVGGEKLLFELALELEAAQPWADRRPPVFAR